MVLSTWSAVSFMCKKRLSGGVPNNWIIALTHSCACTRNNTLYLILWLFYMLRVFVVIVLEQFSKQCFMSCWGIKMFVQHNSLLPPILCLFYVRWSFVPLPHRCRCLYVVGSTYIILKQFQIYFKWKIKQRYWNSQPETFWKWLFPKRMWLWTSFCSVSLIYVLVGESFSYFVFFRICNSDTL